MALDIHIQRPGTYFTFEFSPATAGFLPLTHKVGFIGIAGATGTATVEAISERVLSPTHADSLFEAGSELALRCRRAFALGAITGSLPEIYGIPLAAPAGGGDLPAISTITISGTPTVADELVVAIAGRALRIGVSPSSTPTTMAAALLAAMDGNATILPVTGEAAAGVVTSTHQANGVNGNAVTYEAMRVPSGVTVAIEQTQAGVGATDITNALDASLNVDFNGLAVANTTAGDITDAETHLAEAWAPGTKLWRLVQFHGDGSLGTVQALSPGDFRIPVSGTRSARGLPSEIAAEMMAACFSRFLPNYNFDAQRLSSPPPDIADRWTGTEVEALLDAGISPLNPTADGVRLAVEKYVTSQTEINDVPSFVLRDIVVPKTGAFIARQIDALYAIRRPQTREAIRDLVLEVNRLAEAANIIREVDELLDQITVTDVVGVPGRVAIQNPIRVNVPIHQADFTINAQV